MNLDLESVTLFRNYTVNMSDGCAINLATLEIIAGHVRNSIQRTPEVNQDLFETILRGFNQLPDELRQLLSAEYRQQLLNDSHFASMCDLKFSNIDSRWDAIYAGFALYCQEYHTLPQLKSEHDLSRE